MGKDWRYWLKQTAKYYKITQKEVYNGDTSSRAKSTFYWLIFKAGIDLYKVSVSIGKGKSTIATYINNNVKRETDRFRDKSAEEYIINQSKNE